MYAHAIAVPPDVAGVLAEARPRLGPFGARVFAYASVSSTNDVAIRLASTGVEEGTTVLADAQRAGRGRQGRAWFSPAGAGLYVSVVLRPRRLLPQVPLAAGVALADGVKAATGLLVEIKWPNDLVIGRRKLGGILTEAVGTGERVDAVVLGYGINLRAVALPGELRDRATSIEAELGKPPDRGVVLVETLAALAARYRDLQEGRLTAILDRWRDLAPASHGRTVEWSEAGVARRGVAAGIDDEGRLIVRIGDALERLAAGEVRWLD